MRRLALGSLAVLALAVAFHLGADTGSSAPVGSLSGAIVAVWQYDDYAPRILDQAGVVWIVDSPGAWHQDPAVPPLPVPASSVRFINGKSIVTDDDCVWRLEGSPAAWVHYGCWPGGAAVQQMSWGRIKAGNR